MFLTIGEKVRLCRKKYGFKQSVFEIYGMTQNYISLIENNKRVLREDMIELLYHAFDELTEGKIRGDYSYQEFKKSKKIQAKEWIQEEWKKRGEYDRELISIAKQFNIIDVLYNYYMELAYEFQSKGDYQSSNKYFNEAITYALQLQQSMVDIYKEMATNLLMDLNETGALAYYQLALHYTENDEERYWIQLYIGATEALIGDLDKSLHYANENIKKSQDEMTVRSSLILKEYVLRKRGKLKEGREVLRRCFKSSHDDEDAYYNLAMNYAEDQRFEEAFDICKSLLNCNIVEGMRDKIIILMASIHIYQKDYGKALSYLSSIKNQIFLRREQRNIRHFYKIYLKCLFELEEDKLLVNIIKEIVSLVRKGEIREEVINDNYLSIIEYCAKRQTDGLINEIFLEIR